MATYYSSNYKPMTIGSTTFYEPVPIPIERAGYVTTAWFTASIPVGFTTGDIMKLVPYQTNCVAATPQIQGIRHQRVVITSAGDVGGSVTVNFGFTGANAVAYGSALTTLQSATTLDVPIATLNGAGAPVLLANDDLQLVAAAGTSTTLRVITGFVQAFMQAP